MVLLNLINLPMDTFWDGEFIEAPLDTFLDGELVEAPNWS